MWKKIYKYLIIVFKINIKKILVKKIVDIWYVCKLKGNNYVENSVRFFVRYNNYWKIIWYKCEE